MTALDLQKFLFKTDLTWRELLQYQSEREKTYKIQVFRNHSFEMIEHMLDAYLDYAEIGASFSYSGYDDSFSFVDLDKNADLVILWIDTTRYVTGNSSDFIEQRLSQLRMEYLGPVLVVPYGVHFVSGLKDVTVFDLEPARQRMGKDFSDERAKNATGTPLSRKAMMFIVRQLGLRYLPAMLRPALKSIIVDLDNTLYQGVLGEDGVSGLMLSPGHEKLQRYLKELSQQGFFLCVASKNDEQDVEELFAKRQDFPLRKEDFTFICASWDEKAQSVRKIAELLNIAPDSMVFLDDNIGELMAMHVAIPEIKLILADEDGEVTRGVLEAFPGLFKLNGDREDSVRKSDVQANVKRREMQQAMSQTDYIRSLNIRLTYARDRAEQIARVSELANKTNQFIFNYKRYTQAEIEMRMQSPEYAVVTVSMKDQLSDSGLIGVCVGRKADSYVDIEEYYMSCRALGRGVDSLIVLEAIRQILDYFGLDRVHVCFQDGPRNLPAKKFVEQYLSEYMQASQPFRYEEDTSTVEIQII